MSDRRGDGGSSSGDGVDGRGGVDDRDGGEFEVTDERKDEFELTDEQEAALDLDRNVSITAGAGTGKTTTLEERYRHLLESEPGVDPTNVVTITFTRDATAELRDGIREVVAEQLASAGPDEYDRWRRAMDAVEDAYVHTIHGFCSRILHEYSVEADVHPDAETLDETDAAVLVEAVARDVVMAALDEGVDASGLAVSSSSEERSSDEGTRGEETHDEEPDEPRFEAVAADVRRLARLYTRDELTSLLAGLVSERPDSDAWADAVLTTTEAEYVEDVIERACPVTAEEADELADRDEVREALETIRELAGQEFAFTAADDSGRETLDRVADVLPAGGVDACSTTDLQRLFLELCDVVTTGDGDVYSRSHYYAGSATRWSEHGREADNKALTAACGTLIEALDPGSRDVDVDLEAAAASAPFVFSIARLYRLVRDEYDERKASRNALDYSDLIDRTVAFLERNDRARRELREQFEYVMVDEVQDTDPRQWDLVRLLTGTDAPGFDGENVFLVGDEKQSIYRFRQADVTMVRRARDRLAAANPDGVGPDEELSGNFRTLEEPLEFLNDLFDEVFRPEDEADEESEAGESGDMGKAGEEAGYRPYEAEPQRLTAERQNGTDIEGGVEYLVTPEREEDVPAFDMEGTWFADRTFETREEREAATVAARLTRLFDDPPTVYDEAADEYRPAEPSDVAILFRATTRLRAFERALEDHEIPYTSAGGQSLYETPEIQPLVNLLQVLQEPERDVPLYGVLRSPLFGFTDDELAALYDSDPKVSLWERLGTVDERSGTAGEPAGETEERLRAAADRLASWRAACGVGEGDRSTKWGAFVSRVVDETGYLVSVGADERPSQAVVNVSQFRETLRGWEEGSALPLADVLTRIERERSFGDDAGEGEIPTDVEGAQLRTVHSAKGLEFPIVVVPELGRGAGGGATIAHDLGRFNRGLAYLETVDGEPVLGIRGPDPDDPLGTAKTPDWRLAEEVQAREERAEAKRVLYVATTRVRDHLLLSSTHRFEEDGEESFGPIGEGEDASCWRDWVQPVVLEGRDLLPELRERGVAERRLGGTPYRVRLPPEPVGGPGEVSDDGLEYAIEIPAPESGASKRPLSATDFRDLVADQSAGDQSAGDQSAGDQLAAESEGSRDEAGADETADEREPFFDPADPADGLDAPAFGTLVHRLCELVLGGVELDWDVHPSRVVDDPAALTPADLERAREQVGVGVRRVDELEDGLDVVGTYDELPVTLELDAGRISGDVDHLTVTEDRYYVTDYKTDSLEYRDADELAEHYWPQLRVYAAALQQADPKAEVTLRLVFTEEDELRSETIPADAISGYRASWEALLANT